MHETIRSLSHRIQTHDVTATLLAEQALQRAQEQSSLGAFMPGHPDAERILEQAHRIDKHLEEYVATPLSGIPVAIKDNFCEKDMICQAGSKILQDWVSPYESMLTQSLKAVGAIAFGRTAMDEFGMGSTTDTGISGICRNPHGKNLSPGGSSGGSAVAVASGIVPIAIGTDTGGSVRQPAALTGTYGLKPSYGRVSRHGVIAYASSLDQPGIFARSVEDLAIVLDRISGRDNRDRTTAEMRETECTSHLQEEISSRIIAIPANAEMQAKDPEILRALEISKEALKSKGYTFQEIEIPLLEKSLAAYYAISSAEAFSNLSRYDGIRYGYRSPDGINPSQIREYSRDQGFGAEVKRRILAGSLLLQEGYEDRLYERATAVREILKQGFHSVFASGVAAILLPVTDYTAFPIRDQSVSLSKEEIRRRYDSDFFTVPASLAGLPALSVPVCKSESKLPIGVQLISGKFQETTLLQTALQLELALAKEEVAHD